MHSVPRQRDFHRLRRKKPAALVLNLKTGFKIFRLLTSLKTAVFTLCLIALLTAVGTIAESRFDQETANKLIYQSLWMNGALLLLILNLSAVLIDRWPWRKKHIPFVLAHTGILVIIAGAFLTRYFGADGSMRLKEGGSSDFIVLPSSELSLYSSYDGLNWTWLYREDVDFFRRRPSEKKPKIIQAAGERFLINDYMPFGLPRQDYRAAQARTFDTRAVESRVATQQTSTQQVAGSQAAAQRAAAQRAAALRFHLKGSAASWTNWIELPIGKQTETQSIGPAHLTLTRDLSYRPSSDKELVLYLDGERLFRFQPETQKRRNARRQALQGRPLQIKTSPAAPLKGRMRPVRIGKPFSVGWMDFQFRLLEFFPRAESFFVFSRKTRPSDHTVPAVRAVWRGKEAWMGRNSSIRFYDSERVYALSYRNKRKTLGFSLRLLDFRRTNWPGSLQAKSYESLTETPEGQTLISMNEPLKLAGFTFYQASFEETAPGAPEVSILSVNQDPGRPLKYGGSGALIAGVILLFYRRRRNFRGLL